MKIARAQHQMPGQAAVDLKAPSHTPGISQWSSFHIHELARTVDDRLAITCIGSDYSRGKVGLRVDSQSRTTNQIIVVIKILGFEVSSR